jgi:hypothetical protein
MMSLILSIALVIGIMILLVTHVYFLFTAQSTIESSELGDFNPFHEGDDSSRFSKTNMRQVFGTYGMHYWLPIAIP